MNEVQTALPPRQSRALWAIAGFASLAVVGLACVLEPDPSGMGTHEQLGLPPCGFLYLTGLPCPTCGLTTSFAYMARLQITSAFAAHWLGPLLFAMTVVTVALAAWGVTTAKPSVDAINGLRLARLAAIIAAAVLSSWAARLTLILLA